MASPSTTSMKLDAKTKERVQRLASVRRRSAHWVMCEAIEQYLEREPKREQLRQDALAAWNHYQTTGTARVRRRSRRLDGQARSGQGPRSP